VPLGKPAPASGSAASPEADVDAAEGTAGGSAAAAAGASGASTAAGSANAGAAESGESGLSASTPAAIVEASATRARLDAVASSTRRSSACDASATRLAHLADVDVDGPHAEDVAEATRSGASHSRAHRGARRVARGTEPAGTCTACACILVME
jgi:hypothetical protein